jgi:predicted TIM-barrel fold metal-dependent hydrolase
MIIDVHTHIWDPKYLSDFHLDFMVRERKKAHLLRSEVTPAELGNAMPPPDFEKFIADLDASEVDKAVVMAFDITRMRKSRIPNELVVKFMEKYPDRIIGFASWEALDIFDRFNKKGLKEFEYFVNEQGMRGLKMGPDYGHFTPDDKAVYPFYQKAEEMDVPLLIHQSAAGAFVQLKYSDPVLLEDVALDFPDLRICIAHLGWGWSERTFLMMQECPNIYVDTAFMCRYPYRVSQILSMAKEFGVIDRVLFGTDYPGRCNPHKAFIEWFREGCNPTIDKFGGPTLTKSDIDGILGNNALKFLGEK